MTTPLGRWLRNVAQRLRGVYYEGPEPPERLAMMVQAFALHHPHATPEQWAEFAVLHGAECYRSGYMRGVEWTDRDLERRDPAVDPEVLAEAEEHDWQWAGPTAIELEMQRGDVAPPPDLPLEQQALYLDLLSADEQQSRTVGRRTGRF